MSAKFCRGCKHARVAWWERLIGKWKWADCTHDSALLSAGRTTYDVVSGNAITRKAEYRMCASHRRGKAASDSCGVEGSFWEPRS